MAHPIRASLVAVALLFLFASGVSALGGDEIRIISSVDAYLSGIGLVAAADGRLFAAAATNDGVEVVVSENGGGAWDEWAYIGGESTVTWRNVSLALVPDSPERLAVSYVRDNDAKIATASIDTSPPVLSYVTANVTGTVIEGSRVAARAGGDLFTAFVAADGVGVDIVFRRSATGGTSYLSPVTLANAVIGVVSVDVAAGAGDEVWVAWVVVDTAANPDVASIWTMSATNDGATLADWGTPFLLDTFEPGAPSGVTLRICASPTSGEVVVAVGEGDLQPGPHDLRVYPFTGVVWFLPPETVPNTGIHDAIWEAGGPALAAHRHLDEGVSLGVVRPTAGITSTWVGEPVMTLETPHYAALAWNGARNGHALAATGRHLSESESAAWVDGEWRDAPGVGATEAGFPVLLTEVSAAPLARDLDGDGVFEFAFPMASLGGLVNSEFWTLDPVTGVMTGFGPCGFTGESSAPASCDLDDDGTPELFLGNLDGFVHGWDASGVPLPGWPVDLQNTNPTWVSCGAVVARADVVAVNDRTIHLLGEGGLERPGFPITAPPFVGVAQDRASLGDVDADGLQEIVVPFENGVVILGPDGSVEGLIPIEALAAVALVDMDEDGDLELVFPGGSPQAIHAVHHNGTSIGPGFPYGIVSVLPAILSPVSVANVVGSTGPDFTFTIDGVDLVTINAAGVLKSQRSGSFFSPGEPIIEAFAPGGSQVAWGRQSAGTTQGLWSPADDAWVDGWPRDFTFAAGPWALGGDFDGDGTTELALFGDHATVLDMGVPPAPAGEHWRMAGGNSGRTGCFACGPVTSTATPIATPSAPAVRLAAGPNPFAAGTDVSFALAVAGGVELAAYDVGGRRVATLASGPFAAGDHRVSWSPGALASGVYFLRLEVDGRMAITHRVVRTR